jgi:hypothetical protein
LSVAQPLCRKAIIARDWATPNALAIVELLPTEMGNAHQKMDIETKYKNEVKVLMCIQAFDKDGKH